MSREMGTEMGMGMGTMCEYCGVLLIVGKYIGK